MRLGPEHGEPQPKCTAPEGWPCDDVECLRHIGGDGRHRTKAEHQVWTKDGELHVVFDLDERGLVQVSEEALGQLLLAAGWERTA